MGELYCAAPGTAPRPPRDETRVSRREEYLSGAICKPMYGRHPRKAQSRDTDTDTDIWHAISKTMHARLQLRAKTEGVSLNHLVATYIAEGLGRSGAR